MNDTKFYKIVKPFVKFLVKILYRPQVVGLENIPKEGGVVLAGNHTKWLDPVTLVAITKRQVHFLAKEELFHGITKIVAVGMGSIPVDRKNHTTGAFNNSNKTLEKGNVIGIFPEGTINRTDDVIMPFKTGAVKMANKTDSYLVPFTITGKYKLFRKSIRFEFKKAYKVSNNIKKENDKLMSIISKELIKYNKEK